MENGVLLVKEVPAEKRQSLFAGLKISVKPVNALKGELLIPIPGDKLVPRSDGGKPHNYQLARDTTVSLQAEPDEVAPLNKHEFAVLAAVKEPHTRYSIFISVGKIDWTLSLRKDSEVYVFVNPEAHPSARVHSKAVVRWLGELKDQRGTFFGVEIMDETFRGQGTTDGTFQGKRYFHCEDGCGFFVSLDKLSRNRDGSDLAAPSGMRYGGQSHDQSKGQGHFSQQSQQSGPATRSRTRASKKVAQSLPTKSPRFKVKDRVVVYSNKGTAVHGTVRWIGKYTSKDFKSIPLYGLEIDVPVKKSEFPDALPNMSHLIKATGTKNVKLFLPEPFLKFEAEVAAAKKQEKLASASTGTSVVLSPDPALALGIGSMVQVSGRYGVLRWIGELAEVPGTIAGVELEEGMDGCTDGSRNGIRYFTCKPRRGFFCLMSSLRPDERFTSPGEIPGATTVRNPLWEWPQQESIDQHGDDIDASKYIGDERGIQGHQNSCYLDAAVFGLFAVSDAFDSIFFTVSDAEVSEILHKRIVNPLRKHGVVRYESVMALRNILEMKGVNQDEKDPEKFLNMLFKHVLHVEPFITIKLPFGVEQEYFVQLFLEFDESVPIPSVGFLIRKMFKEQSISFTEAPSKLLIQVPRFGKKFKTYDKIVPDLQLDIGELLPSPYKCLVCSEPAQNKCNSCLNDGSGNSVYFCDVCCDRAHSEATNRGSHQVETTTTNTSSMQLLSVVCVETSHYVCFTHSGGRWIFMDSMADRVHDTYNIPRGVDCSQDLNEWIYTQDQTQLLSTPSRELPEYVRRFTQDIYMCIYINPDLAMYGGIAEPTTSQLSQLHKLSQPEGHRKEQDLRMKLQLSQQTEQNLQTQLHQSQQKEQDLQRLLQQKEQDHQRLLAQAQQTEQDLQRQLQLTTKAMQDLQLQSHSQASSKELEFWNVPRSDIRVVSEIGRGGWGTVLKGTFQGRAVAVKQLHPDILSKDNIQRLRREVRMMAQVRHPNLLLFIAAVFDDEVERLRSPPLIVMELLDTDLRKAYQTKLILSHDRIPIFRDVAFALNYLHSCREPIIHRDLSAPNVLLEALANNRWKAKVSDFGSANLVKFAQTAAEGAIIYSAPETLPDALRDPNAPKISQTPKIDVYSYGVLLCEVITCKQPDQLSQLKAGIKQSWPLMHSLISSCTNYYPDDRPTIAQVLKQLQKLP